MTGFHRSKCYQSAYINTDIFTECAFMFLQVNNLYSPRAWEPRADQ